MEEKSHKIKFISAREQVASYIRKNIFNGKFKPGEEIRQESLSNELGVSRTPVREAIHLLCNDGLLTQEHHRGAVVRAVSKREIQEKRYIYAILKCTIVHLALSNGIDIPALEKIKEQHNLAYQEKNYRKLSECDDSLNELLYEACDNYELNKLCVKMAMKGSDFKPRESISAFAEWLYPYQNALIEKLLAGDEPGCLETIMYIDFGSNMLP